MSALLSERDIKIFKSNVVSGLFDGVIFGVCFGGVYGPVALYQPGIEKIAYKRSIYKYIGKSVVKGAPLVAITRCVGDICDSKQIGPVGKGLITFTAAIAYLSLTKFP
ncbi:hypothetical protein ABPG72_000727 [Tetrahymena utriculariae]